MRYNKRRLKCLKKQLKGENMMQKIEVLLSNESLITPSKLCMVGKAMERVIDLSRNAQPLFTPNLNSLN